MADWGVIDFLKLFEGVGVIWVVAEGFHCETDVTASQHIVVPVHVTVNYRPILPVYREQRRAEIVYRRGMAQVCL